MQGLLGKSYRSRAHVSRLMSRGDAGLLAKISSSPSQVQHALPEVHQEECLALKLL